VKKKLKEFKKIKPINILFLVIIIVFTVFNIYQINSYYRINKKIENEILQRSNDISNLIRITLQRELENKYYVEELFYKSIFLQFRNYEKEIAEENYVVFTKNMERISGKLDDSLLKNFPNIKEVMEKKLYLVELFNDGHSIYLSGTRKNGLFLIAKFDYPEDIVSKISIYNVLDLITKSSNCKKIEVFNKKEIIYSSGRINPSKNVKRISVAVEIYDSLNEEYIPAEIVMYNNIAKENTIIKKNFITMIITVISFIVVILLIILFYIVQRKYIETREYIAEKEKEIMMGTIAAGVAHEIRNPLNAINYSVEFMKNIEKEPKILKYINIIAAEIQKINGTIEEFLSIKKDIVLSKDYFSLEDVVREVSELFEAETVQKNIKIIIEEIGESRKVYGDRNKIREIIVNLIKNGVEALAEKKDNKKIIIKIFDNGIEITDNGCGIKKENIGNIFDFYFTTKSGGNGIGLFRAKKIVEAHGGKIEVESKPNEYTKFRFYLPEVKNEKYTAG